MSKAVAVDVSYQLRPLLPDDLHAVHGLSVEVGWPHRLEDVRFLSGLGRGTVACDAGGCVVGSALWWPAGDDAGTLGMVIVRPGLQGRGLGRRLLRRVLDEAGRRRMVLNATEAGRALYEADGFVPVGRLHQWQGVTVVPAGLRRHPASGHIRPLAAGDLPAVAALDLAASGRDRSGLIAALAETATGLVHASGDGVAGFAFTRAFGRGHVVGPLVATDDDAACALIAPSLDAHAGQFLRIDAARGDGPFADLLEGAGLRSVDTPLTMARGGPATATRPGQLYAAASQALG